MSRPCHTESWLAQNYSNRDHSVQSSLQSIRVTSISIRIATPQGLVWRSEYLLIRTAFVVAGNYHIGPGLCKPTGFATIPPVANLCAVSLP